MLRMQSDLIELCLAGCAGELDQKEAVYDSRAAVGVVLAAANYPGEPKTGDVIHGLDHVGSPSAKIFQAGTTEQNGQVVTNGGRVLCATALGNTVLEAQQKAYELAQQVSWDGVFYRSDIGYRAIAREQAQ